jgi:hypothetical protein
MEPMEDEELRLLLAERLSLIGKAIGEAGSWLPPEEIDRIIPRYKRELFRECLTTARTSILQALDTLMPRESPTTEALVESILERWKTLTEPDRKRTIEALRAGFKLPEKK